MAENIFPQERPFDRGTLPPFKHDDISETRELRGYDSREMVRRKKIAQSESPNLFYMPCGPQMFDQFCRFASQYVVGRQTPRPDSPPDSRYDSGSDSASDSLPASLPDIYALDVVFVAVNIGGNMINPKRNRYPPSDIGIAVLDTRDLRSATTFSTSPPEDIIKTQHFTTKPQLRRSKFYNSCHFGKTEHVRRDGVKNRSSVLLDSLFIGDDQPDSPNLFRNIVLVGHDLYRGLDGMSSLGIRAEAFSQVVGLLDTQRIGRVFLEIKEDKDPSLRLLLEELQCPDSTFYNAGNRANFALKALLLMAANFGQRLAGSSVERKRVAILKEIALTPVQKARLPRSGVQEKRKQLKDQGIFVDWADVLSRLNLDD